MLPWPVGMSSESTNPRKYCTSFARASRGRMARLTPMAARTWVASRETLSGKGGTIGSSLHEGLPIWPPKTARGIAISMTRRAGGPRRVSMFSTNHSSAPLRITRKGTSSGPTPRRARTMRAPGPTVGMRT